MQNFQQQYSSSHKVITGSFDDLQHIVYAQIKIIILTYSCCKIQQISKKNDSGYPHDGRADKNPYPHDRRADKDSYPHDTIISALS